MAEIEDFFSDWRRRVREDLKGWQGPIAVLPAVITYVLVAVGHRLSGVVLGEWEGEAPSGLEAVMIVTMFSVSHGFLLAMLFGFAWKSGRGLGGPMAWIGLGTFYGIPVFVLASETGWLSLAGFALHVALSPRGARMWTSIEYGSSSFCLLLFLMVYETSLFPWGLPVLLFQAGLLLLMHLTVRHLWIKTRSAEEDAAETPLVS